jgi:hypothetical protein
VELSAEKRHEVARAFNPCGWFAEAGHMEAAGVVHIAKWRVGTPQGGSGQSNGNADGPLNGTTSTRARVLAIADRCWNCRAKVRGVVGVLVDTSSGPTFVSFTEVAEALAGATDPRTLAARGIGALRHRDSPGIRGGYVSNGCVECDELVGRILLDDLLDEHLRNGGTYAQLDTGLAVHLPPPGAEPSLRRSA